MWQPDKPDKRVVDWRGIPAGEIPRSITRELWRLWLPDEPLPRYLRPPPAYRRW